MTDTGYLIRREVWGHGSFGHSCEVCEATDYLGPIEHVVGCRELTEQVKKLRRLLKDPTTERET
jgi:molybdopterin/thiamine biosynthesis adenylyltransferase